MYLPTMRGVMVTDRARSYDARALSWVRQQKCLAHVLRSISEVVQTKVGRGRTPDRSRGHGFGKRLSELLREAMELRESERRGEVVDYVGETERLRREVSHHLRDRRRCLTVITGGCRTSLAGRMTVVTC